MATLAIRKPAWQGLSNRDRKIVRHLGDVLQLGTPVEYKTPTDVRWFIFDDWRFKARVIAYFGCALANLSDVPAGYAVPQLPEGGDDKPQLRRDIRAFCESPVRTNPLVLPRNITFSDGGNVWQEILDAQNTPAAVRMGSGVPATWTPVEVP